MSASPRSFCGRRGGTPPDEGGEPREEDLSLVNSAGLGGYRKVAEDVVHEPESYVYGNAPTMSALHLSAYSDMSASLATVEPNPFNYGQVQPCDAPLLVRPGKSADMRRRKGDGQALGKSAEAPFPPLTGTDFQCSNVQWLP